MKKKLKIQEIFNNILNEGSLEDFKYDIVKKTLQTCLNNQSLTLDDISSDNYFILGFDLFNQLIFSFKIKDKSETIKLINYYKKQDNIWKIYVEKPKIGAVVYLRKENTWITKK